MAARVEPVGGVHESDRLLLGAADRSEDDTYLKEGGDSNKPCFNKMVLYCFNKFTC